MSLIGRHFNWFRNFGPYIVQSTISDELHQILLGTANKIRKNKKLKLKNDYRHKLAGNLSEEYSYSGAFTDKEEFIVDQELRWLASHFTKHSKQISGKDYSLEPNEILMQKPIFRQGLKAM